MYLRGIMPTPLTRYRQDRFRGIMTIPSTHKVFDDGTYHVWDPTVHLVGGTYYMIYSRWPKASGFGAWQTESRIHYATASAYNGTFTDQGELLPVGGVGEWDEEMVHNPKVIQDGSNWRMYYYSRDGSGTTAIGCATATSINGTYTKSGNNPIIEEGGASAWDEEYVSNPTVIKVGSTYYLYYRADAVPGNTSDAVGLATASAYDGPYSKHGSNPVLNPTRIEDPHIWLENGTYMMSFIDVAGGISSDNSSGLWAWSTDLTTWTQPTHGYLAYERTQFGSAAGDATGRHHIFMENGRRKYLYLAMVNAGQTATQISVATFADYQ